MKKLVTLTLTLSAICLWISTANTAQASATGEELFKQHCSVCHPNGGNIIKPHETLYKGEREVNTVEAIVDKMRNPGPGMSKFDSNVLPDSDAKAIAEHILKTF
ncbi:MAG: c-type cytochrome [Deltaproteobacteria bacterium]|nr:c-type cytochrome [Deltaproteobacteria bacterium]